jgi:hypothetical protein
MRIYTGAVSGEKLERAKALDLGFMISTSPARMPTKDYAALPCALDNGAFGCWQKGYPFQADLFRATVAKSYAVGIPLDFIVCPDIVAGGSKSLAYSMEWAKGELNTAPRLALAVQDGMQPGAVEAVEAVLRRGYFSHLFVGGTVGWKWETAAQWIKLAHDHGRKCHIGRCGRHGQLLEAHALGADSVDSTNFSRNESWHVIELYRDEIHGRQLTITGGKCA